VNIEAMACLECFKECCSNCMGKNKIKLKNKISISLSFDVGNIDLETIGIHVL